MNPAHNHKLFLLERAKKFSQDLESVLFEMCVCDHSMKGLRNEADELRKALYLLVEKEKSK